MHMTDSQFCRLCGSETSFLFCQRVLLKHDVRYFRCMSCDLIQSEEPWWLGEAYSSAITAFDTGAIARNGLCSSLTNAAAWLLGLTPHSRCADMGGGHGVFVRMMRDRGLDFRLCDKYAENLFARGFEADPRDRFTLVTCFEVMEHFADVAGELERLFAPGHDAVLVSTVLHRGHREGWWYYGPTHGQHIAFYSRQTMRFIADRFGCDAIVGGAYTIFVNRRVALPKGKRMLLSRLIRGTRADRDWKGTAAILAVAPRFPSLTSMDSRQLLEQRRAVA
jgi:hypothetical protein